MSVPAEVEEAEGEDAEAEKEVAEAEGEGAEVERDDAEAEGDEDSEPEKAERSGVGMTG